MVRRIPSCLFRIREIHRKHFRRIHLTANSFTQIKDEPMQKIRNIGVMAHIDAGKTTTSERMLYYSGFSRHLGDVDDGDTVMDYMEQERERGITISSAAITLHWNKHKINLIDTPGHVDFTVEVERCLRVLDGAVTVIDASAGVEAQTLTVWKQANSYNIPIVVFLNKMDKPKANIHYCLESIENKLKTKPILINIPQMDGNKVIGVVDLIRMEKMVYDFDSNSDGQKFYIAKLTPECDEWDMASVFKSRLIGDLADHDESLADQVLTDSEISAENIQEALRKATLSRKVVPVLCGSALKNAGIQPLLDAITYYLPSPLDRTYDMVNFYESDLCAFAFKIIHDRHRGPLTFLRLYSGVMKAGDSIYNVNKEVMEKPSRLIHVYSNEYHDVTTASAGNIICIAGLKATQTGDTITASKTTAKMAAMNLHHHHKLLHHSDHDPSEIPILGGIHVQPPVFLCSVESPSISVQKSLDIALACLQREDPSLLVKVEEETGQTILGGMGELHLEIIKQRLLGEYKLDVYMGPLQVAYKETIENETSRYEVLDATLGDKKQHAGLQMSLHFNPTVKQFKHVKIIKSSDEGMENIKRNHLKAIEIGVQSALSHGAVLNFPVIDVEVCLHKVEIGRGTTDAMLSACASMCITNALKQANSVLLEPMMKMEITTNEDNLHAVMTDLTHRRSQAIEVDCKEDMRVVQAITPLAETMGYFSALRSKTHGMATFTMEFSHYAKMTPHDQQIAIQKVTGFS